MITLIFNGITNNTHHLYMSKDLHMYMYTHVCIYIYICSKRDFGVGIIATILTRWPRRVPYMYTSLIPCTQRVPHVVHCRKNETFL